MVRPPPGSWASVDVVAPDALGVAAGVVDPGEALVPEAAAVDDDPRGAVDGAVRDDPADGVAGADCADGVDGAVPQPASRQNATPIVRPAARPAAGPGSLGVWERENGGRTGSFRVCCRLALQCGCDRRVMTGRHRSPLTCGFPAVAAPVGQL